MPWARFDRSWALLGPLGRLLEALETPLGRSWSLLGASWTPLGRNLEKVSRGLAGTGLNLEAKIHPSWLQDPRKINVKKQLDFEVMFFLFF